MNQQLKELLEQKKLSIDHIIRIIDWIRPKNRSESELAKSSERLDELIILLKQTPVLRKNLSIYIIRILSAHNPGYLYRERSLFGNSNIVNKFWKLLRLKILPKSISRIELDTFLDAVFKKKRDYIWVKTVSTEKWDTLFRVLNMEELFVGRTKNMYALINNITLISYRIAALGLDSDIINKLPIRNDEKSPFLIQNKEIQSIMDRFDASHCSMMDKQSLQEIITKLDECRDLVHNLRANKKELGISLHLTYISKRLLQQIERLKLLLNVLYHHCGSDLYSNFTKLFIEILEYQEVKNSVRKLMRESVNLLAFEIVEHTAQKGEKYIAANAKEYYAFLGKSMLGGAIIAIFASFKILMDRMDTSPLGEGMLFGLNYALCFVLVYFVGGIIATKQPAMTASNLVQAIDEDEGESVDKVKNLIIRVSRSQFVSFLGNLLLAFPIAFLIGKAFPTLFNDILLNAYKTDKLLSELLPIRGGAIYFAAIAGIILSLAGLISGYFDNKVIYSDIPDRIEKHPFLSKYFPRKWNEKLGAYIKKNSGALAGNISLGFMLGLAGSFGFFTGLPLDIRHVAFSSANLGYALQYLDFNLNIELLITVIIGVLAIGLVNFIVSFSVTFWIAMRSRNAGFKLYKKVLLALFLHFIMKPHHFFMPVNLDKDSKSTE